MCYSDYEYADLHSVINSSHAFSNTDVNVSLSDCKNTCMGLKVKCTSVKEGMPWLAAVFVEGKLSASAVLVTENWLIVDSHFVQNLK